MSDQKDVIKSLYIKLVVNISDLKINSLAEEGLTCIGNICSKLLIFATVWVGLYDR